MRLHALVSDHDAARGAVEGGATVVQLRLKDLPTPEVVDRREWIEANIDNLRAIFGRQYADDGVLRARLALGLHEPDAAVRVALDRADGHDGRGLDEPVALGVSAAPRGLLRSRQDTTCLA